MTQYLLILASAFALAVGGTPLVRRLAVKLGVVDQPNPRKIHSHPIPLLGGVAIYLAFIAALVFFGDRFYVQQVVGILLGATLCSLMGLWDDRRGLSAFVKLAGQLVAAVILIVTGVRVQTLPFEALNLAVTFVWVVGITNAINLLDNMDGLSGGVGAIAAAFFLLLAAGSGQYLVGALAAALLGACVGFLVYNFNPASIFMGDTGTLFMGFLLAAVGIKLRFPDNSPFLTWMIPLFVLGLPIFDTSLVFISRLRRGLNPLTTPGKDHVSHRLVKMGYTRREAVLILYLVCGALGVMAMYLTQATTFEGYALGGIVFVVGLYLIYRLERVGGLPSVPSEAQPTEPSALAAVGAADRKI
jgi:UDP-GlcNAc:undecaprenyl-phosphate GlcNAc-1-phosphate transferase